MVVNERDEELFLKLRRSEQENESNGSHLIASSDEVDAPLGFNPLGSPISKSIAVTPSIKDGFLDSENETTDFVDWLLSPPRNALLPSSMSEQNGVIMTDHSRTTALTSLDVENVVIEVVATKKTQVSCGAAVKKKSSSLEAVASTRRRRPAMLAAPAATKPVCSSTRPTARSSTPSTVRKLVSPPSARSSSASKTRPTVSKPTTMLQNTKKDNNSQSLVAEASSRRRASSTGRRRMRQSNGNGSSEDVNPVLMGTQMVERIVNMRKLAPPDQGSYHQVTENPAGKLSSIDKSTGFGRSLSKKSLDMAMRHMDISSSINGNLRSLRLLSRKDHHKTDHLQTKLPSVVN